jgi:exonuclease VII large subunit
VDAASDRLEDAAGRLLEAVQDLLTVSGDRIDVADRLVRATEGVRLRARVRYQSAAGRLQDRVGRSLADGRGVLAELRNRMGTAVVRRTSRARENLGGLGMGISGAAQARLAEGARTQKNLSLRLGREALRPLLVQGTRLESLATQTRLMDPNRLLARGYTITLDSNGRAVTQAAALAVGDIIDTRFSDGQVRSLVQSGNGKPSPQGKGKRSGGKKSEPETDPGQKTLFR